MLGIANAEADRHDVLRKVPVTVVDISAASIASIHALLSLAAERTPLTSTTACVTALLAACAPPAEALTAAPLRVPLPGIVRAQPPPRTSLAPAAAVSHGMQLFARLPSRCGNFAQWLTPPPLLPDGWSAADFGTEFSTSKLFLVRLLPEPSANGGSLEDAPGAILAGPGVRAWTTAVAAALDKCAEALQDAAVSGAPPPNEAVAVEWVLASLRYESWVPWSAPATAAAAGRFFCALRAALRLDPGLDCASCGAVKKMRPHPFSRSPWATALDADASPLLFADSPLANSHSCAHAVAECLGDALCAAARAETRSATSGSHVLAWVTTRLLARGALTDGRLTSLVPSAARLTSAWEATAAWNGASALAHIVLHATPAALRAYEPLLMHALGAYEPRAARGAGAAHALSLARALAVAAFHAGDAGAPAPPLHGSEASRLLAELACVASPACSRALAAAFAPATGGYADALVSDALTDIALAGGSSARARALLAGALPAGLVLLTAAGGGGGGGRHMPALARGLGSLLSECGDAGTVATAAYCFRMALVAGGAGCLASADSPPAARAAGATTARRLVDRLLATAAIAREQAAVGLCTATPADAAVWSADTGGTCCASAVVIAHLDALVDDICAAAPAHSSLALAQLRERLNVAIEGDKVIAEE